MSHSQTWNYERRLTQGFSRQQRIARLDALANLLDTALAIPGTNVRFGLDSLIGLFPGVGDLITSAMSLYIVHEARALGAPKYLIMPIIGNIAVDSLVGAVPVVGDAFDVLFRANRRNMALLNTYLETERRQES